MEVFIDNRFSSKKNTSTLPSLIISPDDTVNTLKSKIVSNFNLSKIDINRIGLSLELTPQGDGKVKTTFLALGDQTLINYGAYAGCTVRVKDLGAQINWRHVYVIEYLGPFIIVFIMFSLNGHFNNSVPRNMLFIMSSFHYLKRILESAFVHEFSRFTMPLKNLFINCAHYWGFYGIICGYFLFCGSSQNIDSSSLGSLRYVFVFLFFLSEIKNLKCHLILRDLKYKNGGNKGIPNGEGFEWVSCANYFWEILSWVFFSLFAGHISVWLFTLWGGLIMTKWATEKHISYKKTFGDKYPKNRKIIIPFIY